MAEIRSSESKKELDDNTDTTVHIPSPNIPPCFPSPTKEFSFISVLLAYGEAQNIQKGLKNLALTILLLTFFIIYVEQQLYVEDASSVESGILWDVHSIELENGASVDSMDTMPNSLLWVRQLTERIYSLDPVDAVYPSNNLEELSEHDRDAMESEAMNYFSDKSLAERSAYASASMRLFEEARLGTSEFNCADILDTTLASEDVYEGAIHIAREYRRYLTGDPAPKTISSGVWRVNNKIVGGMMLSQVRNRLAKCEFADYSSIYPTCLSFEEEDRSSYPGASWPTETYHFDKNTGSFSSFVDLGGHGFGKNLALCRLDLLHRDMWIDRQTRSLTINIGFYNGILNRLGGVEITFEASPGGEIFTDTNLDTVYVGGRKETPQGGDLAEASKKVTSDGVLLIVAYYLLVYFAFIVDVAQAVSMCCHARQNKEACSCRALTQNCASVLWEIIDWLTIIGFSALSFVHLSIYFERRDVAFVDSSEATTIEATLQEVNEALESIESLKYLQWVFITMVVITLLLALLRLLRALSFHDRLSLIPETLANAAFELAHFGLIFVAVTLLFAEIAFIILGPQNEAFRTFQDSVYSLLMVLLGEVDLDGIEGFAATTLYWCFIIFGFVIMLNALLAIVMDSFQTVRESSDDTPPLWSSIIYGTIGLGYTVFKSVCKSNPLQLAESPSKYGFIKKVLVRQAIAEAFVKAFGAREFLLKFRTADNMFPTTRKELRTRAIQEVEELESEHKEDVSDYDSTADRAVSKTRRNTVVSNPLYEHQQGKEGETPPDAVAKVKKSSPPSEENSGALEPATIASQSLVFSKWEKVKQLLVKTGIIVEYPSRAWKHNWDTFQLLVAHFNLQANRKGQTLSKAIELTLKGATGFSDFIWEEFHGKEKSGASKEEKANFVVKFSTNLIETFGREEAYAEPTNTEKLMEELKTAIEKLMPKA